MSTSSTELQIVSVRQKDETTGCGAADYVPRMISAKPSVFVAHPVWTQIAAVQEPLCF